MSGSSSSKSTRQRSVSIAAYQQTAHGGGHKHVSPSPKLSFSLSCVPPKSSSKLDAPLINSSSDSITGVVLALVSGVVGNAAFATLFALLAFSSSRSGHSRAFLFLVRGGVVNDLQAQCLSSP